MPGLNQKGVTHILILIAALGLIAFILVSQSADFKDKLFGTLFPKPPSQAASVRGQAGDLWADAVIGKKDFSETNPAAFNNSLFLSRGVVIDRNSTPNRMYIYDSGHNRILGISDISGCFADTANCRADLVLGQPDFNSAACNGDSSFQNYPTRAPASAATLCGLQEDLLSISEGGSGSSMAVDTTGNLYVTDFFNHRVLKYNKPFETDKIADDVWGQDNFSGQTCNKGQTSPGPATLCFSWGNTNNWTAGVDLDSSGNLWVVDSGNNRVLRFPPGSKTADLVLGQSNFTSKSEGNALNQLRDPAIVRVSSSGKLYVADRGNNRVLIYQSPSTGSSGEVFVSGFGVHGIDFDPTEPGKVWILAIGSSNNNTIRLYDETTKILENETAGLGRSTGSTGVDSQGNVYLAGDDHSVLQFAKNSSLTTPAKKLFGDPSVFLTSRDISSLGGVVVSNNQLIVAADGRLMFWNDPGSLTTYKPADGVAMVNSFGESAYGCCIPIKADKSGHLYIGRSIAGDDPFRVEVLNLPLTNGASPFKTLNLPLPLLGGGQLALVSAGNAFSGILPTDDSKFLYLSIREEGRTIRIRDPLTNPVVDMVFGQANAVDHDDYNTCNRRGTVATPDTLCYPGSMSFDKFGNLYLSDHWLEAAGNLRILVFSPSVLPTNNTSVIYAPTPFKIFPPEIAAFETAFDSQNRMVVGVNPYRSGSLTNGGRFSPFYFNPLSSSTSPDGYLNDFYSMQIGTAFDDQDNLYVGDHNRGKVLIYKTPFSGGVSPQPVPSSTPTPFPATTSSPTSPPVSNTVVISGISQTTTSNSATIKWTTNVPSTSRVSYGTTTSLGSSTPEDINLTINHSVTLTNLASRTRYYFKVHSKNSAGLENSSNIQNFRTKNR